MKMPAKKGGGARDGVALIRLSASTHKPLDYSDPLNRNRRFWNLERVYDNMFDTLKSGFIHLNKGKMLGIAIAKTETRQWHRRDLSHVRKLISRVNGRKIIRHNICNMYS